MIVTVAPAGKWLGWWLIIPSPSTRASRADLAPAVKIVRPAGRFILTTGPGPHPCGRVDGDGMIRQAGV